MDWTECRVGRGPDDGLNAHVQTGRGGRDSNASENSHESLENKADQASETDGDSSRLATRGSTPHPAAASPVSEASDAELEAAIVRAVTAGAFEVARVLAMQLEDRCRARVPENVIELRREGR